MLLFWQKTKFDNLLFSSLLFYLTSSCKLNIICSFSSSFRRCHRTFWRCIITSLQIFLLVDNDFEAWQHSSLNVSSSSPLPPLSSSSPISIVLIFGQFSLPFSKSCHQSKWIILLLFVSFFFLLCMLFVLPFCIVLCCFCCPFTRGDPFSCLLFCLAIDFLCSFALFFCCCCREWTEKETNWQ